MNKWLHRDLGADGSFPVLDGLSVGVCLVNEDRTVCYWNDCLVQWTGVSLREVEGRDLTQVFPQMQTDRVWDTIQEAIQNGSSITVSPPLERPFFPGRAGAGPRGFRMTARPNPVSERGGYFAILTFEDITPHQHPLPGCETPDDAGRRALSRCKALEDEKAHLVRHLRQMQRLESLGVVAGSIAHDFNNLLSVVMGNADIIAAEAEGQQLLSYCCGQIQKATARATELVAQILAYSGGGKVVLDVVNLSTLTSGVAPLLRATVPSQIDLNIALASGLPDVSGDAVQLEQVISNLVAGAVDAIGNSRGTVSIESGEVYVDAAYAATCYPVDALTPGDYAYLEVRDNGAGLDTKTMERLLDPARIAKLGERGLGLASSHDMVRAHHGGMRVVSTPGGGTSVRIHFPVLLEETVAELEDDRVGGLLDAAPARCKILLVDDEEMVRALGEIVLEQNGYAVITAQDGDEAVAAYETHADSLSLVLLDMTMPKRDGYEVARAMRAIRADTPIVLCSGYVGVDARNRFAGLQVDGFLRKPYHLSELLETVERTLNRFHL